MILPDLYTWRAPTYDEPIHIIVSPLTPFLFDYMFVITLAILTVAGSIVIQLTLVRHSL